MHQPPGSAWVDEHAPDPGWVAPSLGSPTASAAEPPAAATRRRWRPHPVLVGVLVLGLVAGLIWVTGGFGRRTDLRIPTSPGQLISTGPYEFTFTKATAQRITGYDDSVKFEVRLIGTGRTTGDRSLSPDYSGGDMYAAKDEATGEIQGASAQRFGPAAEVVDGAQFVPGFPPEDYQVVFEFSSNYRPGPTLTFAVADLAYQDTSLLGTGEKTWDNDDRNYILELPVEKLPDRE